MSATNGPTPGERILGIDPGLQITGYAVIEVGRPRAPRLRGRHHPHRRRPRTLPTWPARPAPCTMV